jgi:hypothetical protein
MEEWIGNIGGALQDESELCLHEDRHPAVTLSTTNPAWTGLLNPGMRDEESATIPLIVH